MGYNLSMRILIYILLLTASILPRVLAADNYATYHTAVEAAINGRLAPYKIACDIVRRGYWTTEAGEISQPTVTVKCTQSADSVTVSWSRPTTRTNGEPLAADEIAGYRLRYRNAEGVAWIDLPAVEQYELIADHGYVALQTIDTDGLVSRLSDEVGF